MASRPMICQRAVDPFLRVETRGEGKAEPLVGASLVASASGAEVGVFWVGGEMRSVLALRAACRALSCMQEG